MNDILSQIIAYSPNKIDTETKARAMVQGPRNMKLAEVPRSEMDNFNTPDLEQAPDSFLRPGETLEDFDVTFRRPNAQGGRIGFKRGNISNHPVKPLTKDQKKIYDMMLKKELPTNRTSVSERLVERFNKPWEKLDSTARANFINQTYPRYKKLLERAGGKISRNQLAKILSEKLGRPISLGQIHGYGTDRSGQRQKTAFGKTLDEVLDVTNVTPKNPMYKIPTDADIKKLKPLLDITPANSLKNSTVDNIVKLNKKYTGMYKNGKLPSLETVLKDFPNMTSTQASNATIRLSQIYSGNKFKLFSNLDPKIKKEIENIKVNKNLGDKVFKLIGDSKFNEYRNSMYRISLGIIDEKLGNSKGTFEKLKNQARQILKDNKIPIYLPEKKNAAGKIIQKAKKGFNINEIAGVSGSAKSKAAEFSQFIDVMEGNLNQKTMANFQSKLSSAREMIENNPEMLSSKSKEINKLAKNLENAHGVKLPRLQDPDAAKYFSPKRLNELKTQGLDIVKAAERAGYTIQMPKGAMTVKEFTELKPIQVKGIAKKLDAAGFKCQLSNGLTCNDPRAYTKSIKENMAKIQQGDDAAIAKLNKLGKGMNAFKGAAKFTGWTLLAELGIAAPLAAVDYAKGANKDEIISNATYGLFGKSEDEQLREKYSDYGQAKDFQKTYDKLLKQENALDDQTGYGPIINPQNVKNTEKKLMEQSKQFDSVLPPSQGLRSEFDLGKFLNMVVTDQQRDKLFADQKAQRAEEIGILKPSTGLESYDNFMQGGIASLNVKK